MGSWSWLFGSQGLLYSEQLLGQGTLERWDYFGLLLVEEEEVSEFSVRLDTVVAAAAIVVVAVVAVAGAVVEIVAVVVAVAAAAAEVHRGC